MTRREGSPEPEGWAGWLLPLLFVLAVLALGTTPSRVLPALAVRTGLLCVAALALFLRRQEKEPLRFHLGGLAFLGLGLVALLQALPVPPSLIQLLSPTTHHFYLSMLESAGRYGQGQWFPFSLDAPASLNAAAAWLSVFLCFALAPSLLTRRRLARVLALLGSLVAALGFMHKLAGAEKILFLYPFHGAPPFFFSVFINPNAMAGFMAFCSLSALALALDSRRLETRLLWLLAFVGMATAGFMSLSVGGGLAFASGLASFFWMEAQKRRDRGKRLLWIEAATLASLGLGAYLAFGELWTKLTVKLAPNAVAQASRLRIWSETWSMIADHPLTGIGSGAYELAFFRYQKTVWHGRVVYPENLFVQIASEQGLVVAGVLAMLVLFLLWRLLRRSGNTLHSGLAAGAIALVISNQFDFNLNLLGVALPFSAALSLLLSRPTREHSSPLKLSLDARKAWTVLFLLAVAILAGTLYWKQFRVEEDRVRMHVLAYDRSLPEERFDAESADLLARHPADRWTRLLASEYYQPGQRSAFPQKMFHLRKAGLLAPSDLDVARQVGRAYRSVGLRDEAVKAYAQAMKNVFFLDDATALLREMAAAGFDSRDLVEAASEAGRHEQLARIFSEREDMKGLSMLLSRWPKDSDAAQLAAAELEITLVARSGDTEKALALARESMSRFPEDWRPRFWIANPLRRLNRPIEARDAYLAALERGADRALMLELAATASLEAGETSTVRDLAGKGLAATKNNPRQKARLLMLFAQAAFTDKDFSSARRDARLASDTDPEAWEPHELMARLFDRFEDPASITELELAIAKARAAGQNGSASVLEARRTVWKARAEAKKSGESSPKSKP